MIEDHRHRHGQTLLAEEQAVAAGLAEIVELQQRDLVARALRGSGFIRLVQRLPELIHRDRIGSRAKVTSRHRRPLDVDDLSRVGNEGGLDRVAITVWPSIRRPCQVEHGARFIGDCLPGVPVLLPRRNDDEGQDHRVDHPDDGVDIARRRRCVGPVDRSAPAGAPAPTRSATPTRRSGR